MADQEIKLLNFQDITGIEDLPQCIAFLERHNWNLEAAFESHFVNPEWVSQHASECESFTEKQSVCYTDNTTVPADLHCADGSAGVNSPPNLDSFSADGLTAAAACADDLDEVEHRPVVSRLLHFIISYQDIKIPVTVTDSNTVGDIKIELNRHTGVPVEIMTLHGWIRKNDSLIHDSDILRDLQLPKENTLVLRTPCYQSCPPPSEKSCVPKEYFNREYELDIFFVSLNKKHLMKFLGSRTIRQVQEDVAVLAGPVRLQEWEGWPTANDSVTLAESGICYPKHVLKVKTVKALPTPKQQQQSETTEDPTESDLEDNDMECADDDWETSKPLIPDRATDQLRATEGFCKQFSARYGEVHPAFFFGSLCQAVNVALQCKAKERKLLAVYLHHDHSAHVNFFCPNILCSRQAVELLSEHFILWPWDITKDSNRCILVDQFRRLFGDATANIIAMLRPDQLPTVLVASHNRGTDEIIKIIPGDSLLDGLLSHLKETIKVFNEQLPDNIVDEEAREVRLSLLRQQESEYNESLEIDRAKRQSKLEQLRHEEEERQRTLEVQRRQEEDAKLKKAAEDSLHAEPNIGHAEPLIAVGFRCPDGLKRTRRFLLSNTLRDLLNYVVVEGFALSSHQVFSNYPRRNLTALEPSMTLDQLKLCPRGETLFIEKTLD